MAIQIKTLDQLKVMRRAGLVVAEIHQAIRADFDIAENELLERILELVASVA